MTTLMIIFAIGLVFVAVAVKGLAQDDSENTFNGCGSDKHYGDRGRGRTW